MSTPLLDFTQDVQDVRSAQAGDRAAFDRLVVRYRGLALAFAFLRTHDRDEAEDLAQRILVKAWTHIGDLHTPAAFADWLRAIAVNACRDWHRRRTASPLFAPWEDEREQGQAPSPYEDVLAREARQVLLDALRTVSQENSMPLLLHVCGGYRYEEIAQLLGLPLTTVEGRIYRARQQLRRRCGLDAGALF